MEFVGRGRGAVMQACSFKLHSGQIRDTERLKVRKF